VGDLINVLMTGAGSPGGPGIIKAISKSNEVVLHVADMNSNAAGRYLTKYFHLIPGADSDDFIVHILNICEQLNIDVLFPLVTKELFKLSQHKKDFELIGTKIIVSEFSDLLIANNKCSLYRHLKKINIKIPDFSIVHDVKDINKAAVELGYPSVPVVMKPCLGNGSRGIRILDSNKNKFELLFNEKPNSLYSNMNDVLASIGDNQIPSLVISEYLPGVELTIDTIVQNGLLDTLLIRTRVSMHNGVSIAGRFIKNKKIEKYICAIVESLPGLSGPIGFQVKQDKNGDYKLLESNPRIQGTSVAALGVGVNLPLLAVFNAAGKTYIDRTTMKNNIGFVRYYQEAFYEY
jgi:carbamoyl-phosphate synthase large subunit